MSEQSEPATRADNIKFSIKSDDAPFVICRLEPGMQMVAEPGAMMSMDDGITTRTLFGDGSDPGRAIVRFFRAIKRPFTGESMVSTVYTNEASEAKDVYFAGPFPGTIMPVRLDELGGELICQKGAFLCAERGTRVSIAFQKRMRAGFFGGEGFIMQKIEGEGLAFIHAGGTLASRTLAPGQTISVDTGCIAALQKTVNYDIQKSGSAFTMIFGGEGLFLARLKGPGKIWLQSLPIRRLSESIISNSVVSGGGKAGKLYLIAIVVFVLISLFVGDVPSE